MKIEKITDLKKEMIKAKKEDKEKAKVLVMLLDYTQKIAKEKIETENMGHLKQAVKKYLKIIEDEEKAGAGNEKEKKVILEIKNQIFPKQFSHKELIHIIEEHIIENPEVKQGQIMGYLKKQFGDKVDMKLASNIVKNLM